MNDSGTLTLIVAGVVAPAEAPPEDFEEQTRIPGAKAIAGVVALAPVLYLGL